MHLAKKTSMPSNNEPQVLQVSLAQKCILTFKTMYIIQNRSLILGAKNYKHREILWSYFKHRFLAFTLFIQKRAHFWPFSSGRWFSFFLQRYDAFSRSGTPSHSSAGKHKAWYLISDKMQMQKKGMSQSARSQRLEVLEIYGFTRLDNGLCFSYVLIL